jgi:hypothetical protein
MFVWNIASTVGSTTLPGSLAWAVIAVGETHEENSLNATVEDGVDGGERRKRG